MPISKTGKYVVYDLTIFLTQCMIFGEMRELSKLCGIKLIPIDWKNPPPHTHIVNRDVFARNNKIQIFCCLQNVNAGIRTKEWWSNNRSPCAYIILFTYFSVGRRIKVCRRFRHHSSWSGVPHEWLHLHFCLLQSLHFFGSSCHLIGTDVWN